MYKTTDLIKVMKKVGFDLLERETKGSHNKLFNKQLGITYTIVYDGTGSVAVGTAEYTLDNAIFWAYIQDIDLTNPKLKLPGDIDEYIKHRLKNFKKNPISIIPLELRKQYNIPLFASQQEGEKILSELKKKILSNERNSFIDSQM